MITTPPSAPPPASWDDAERLAELRAREEHFRNPDILLLLRLLGIRDVALAAANAEITELKEQLADAEIDANAAVITMHKAVELSDRVDAELDAARAEIATLKTDRDSWRRVCERLETELASLRSAAPSGDLRAENERLRVVAEAARDLQRAIWNGRDFAAARAADTLREALGALASPQPDAKRAIAEEAARELIDIIHEDQSQPDAGARGEPDTGLVCALCRWRGGHAPTCKMAQEPWPTLLAPSPSPETAPPSVDDTYDCAKRAGQRFYSMQAWGDGHVQDKIAELERELCAAHQAGERTGREQAVNIMRRYEENQDLGCPEMMEELRALAPDQKENRDE